MPSFVFSQMVGANAYVQGNLVEYGINGNGGYEGVDIFTSPLPAGYHFRSGNLIFGFVANPQNNGWATFDGDFFTPGSPENGWGIEIIDGANDFIASNNCTGQVDIAGGVTAFQSIGNCRIVTWEGNYLNGAYNVHIRLDYILNIFDAYYTTVATFTNNGANIADFYFYRNVDPDNNQSISGDFNTDNLVISQPGGTCNLAHVRAISNLPGSQPASYLGFAAVGNNWRACYGGFSNRDASDLWNGAGFTQTTGVNLFSDIAIAISNRMQNFNSGTAQQIRFVTILDDLAAVNAVNNLFTVTWPGAPPSTSTQCNPVIDTITVCNGSSVNISVNGTALSSFNWTWSPATNLNTTTGASVTCTPTANQLYTVTGTPLNACFNTVTQQVYVRTVVGGVNANAGPDQTLTCTNTSVALTGTSSSASPTFSWTGPGITGSSALASPTVNVPGTYILTVSSGGCTKTDTVQVVLNNTPPNVTAGPDQALNCTVTSLSLAGGSATPSVTYGWSGPGITAGGTTPSPAINAPGSYTVTVTDPGNGCTSTDVATVTQNITLPNANAGPDGILNCTVTSLTLGGTSTTPGAQFTWSGPGIVSGSTTASPGVNAAGTYTVTITDPANGCTNTDQAVVTLNGAVPNVTAGPDQVLTCAITSLNLGGGSITPGVQFAWSGPGIIAGGSTASPLVNAAGTYTLVVTDPSNFCTSTDQVIITQNTVLPDANAGTDMLLTCSTTSVNLAGSSTTAGAGFSWAGPAITAGTLTANPTVNGAGNYTITVTNPVNGCTNTDAVTVNQNIIAPNANAGPDGILNCTINSLNLAGGSSTAGALFAWTGPGITGGAASASPAINAPGSYTVTITDAANGCTSTDVAVVNQNIAIPAATAGPDTVLNCVVTNLNLLGGSSTAGVSFAWSGPGIVSGGGSSSPNINLPGLYTVTVTDPVNGCTNTDMVTVTQNMVLPNVTAGPDWVLTCSVTSLNLAGGSATPGAQLLWTGPGVVAGSNTASALVNLPGAYLITATDPVNGCSQTDTVVVIQNIVAPGANAGTDAVLDCNFPAFNLNGSAISAGATFSWSGPAIVSGASTNNPLINGPGSYILTVTDPVNGCTSTDTADITLNNTPPNILMGANQNILCNTPVVNLQATSATPGVTYAWTGAGIVGPTVNSSVSVNTAGTYTVVITDPANGCTSTGTVDAQLQLNYPTAGFFANNLAGCAPLCATLADNSTVNGSPIVDWLWDVESIGQAAAPGGTFCFTTPGSYDVALTVTTADGCVSTLSLPNYLTVYPNPVAEFVYAPQSITEFNPEVIFGNQSSGGNTYQWDFGDGSYSNDFNTQHMYGDTGAYHVLLTTTSVYGCVDTTEHVLYVAPEFNVFIPNSFTANGDALNELWSVVGRGIKSFEARIFNRWGEEIYFMNNIQKGWNGTRDNGEPCQQGVYVYRVLITDFKGDFHEYIGNVQLIR